MTRSELIHLLQDLYRGVDPFRGTTPTTGTCLGDPAVRQSLNAAIRRLSECESATKLIAADEVRTLKRDLRDMGYPATASQIARVLIGSRTLVDPRLRGLPAYRRYRGVLSRRAIEAALEMETVNDSEGDAAPEMDFFTPTVFDHLTASKANELQSEVSALGLLKPSGKLPGYMQRARLKYSRSFEPWTREERALLIEAMCYTNDADRLALIFGRSASSVRREGQILIRKSGPGKGDGSSKIEAER